MRILLLGNSGQLGWELHRTLSTLGEVKALDYPEIDLSQPAGLEQAVSEARPQVIVNATAYTAVDRAEAESELAYAINGRAPGLLAESATRLGAGLIHYSTDYVFDGTKGSPYLETDTPNPLGVYGASKLAGESAIAQVGAKAWIFRTSWVYSTRRDSFTTKVLGWARNQRALKVVSDQIGNPTWARVLAEITAQLLSRAVADPAGWIGDRGGLYHLAGDGHASRLEWAEAILKLDPCRQEQVVESIQPARTAEFPSPAERPLFSALDCTHFLNTFGLRLPPWQEALRLALESA